MAGTPWTQDEKDLFAATCRHLQSKDLSAILRAVWPDRIRTVNSIQGQFKLLQDKDRFAGRYPDLAISDVQSSKLSNEIKAAAIKAIGQLPPNDSTAPGGVSRGRSEEERQIYEKFVAECVSQEVHRPGWLLGPKKPLASAHYATPHLALSDWHYGEVVDPAAIRWANAYDIPTAENRLKTIISGSIKMAREYLSGCKYDGFVCAVAGDMVSGMIHEELQRTNGAEILPSVLRCSGCLADSFVELADEFGKVYVPWVVGNHGRLDMKPQSKDYITRNFDWLIGNMVKKELKGDTRITVDVSSSLEMIYRVHGVKFLLLHGQNIKGGSGISGMMAPLMLAQHRLARQFASLGPEYQFDCILMGHFHQALWGKSLIVNGSIVGYSEYANSKMFPIEPPQQMFWLVTPERGNSIFAPIFADKVKR